MRCPSRPVDSSGSDVRARGRVGGQQAQCERWCRGEGAVGGWLQGRSERSSAVGGSGARVCCSAGWVVCFPLVRDGTAGSRLEGCWAAHTQREACESWRSDEGNTSRAVPRIAKACRKGNRGSMASTASRAHRGISPHVIPARLRTVYVYRLRRQPARPFYFALWPSGHSSDAANLVRSSGACSARPFSRASKTPAVDHDAFCYCAPTLSAKRASFVINVNVNASRAHAAVHTWAVYRAVRSSPHTVPRNYKGAGRLLSISSRRAAIIY